MATDYLAISSTLLDKGYEVQNIKMNDGSATAKATTSAGPDLIELQLTRVGGEWLLSP